jgi:transposase
VELLFERVAELDIGKATLTACMCIPGPGGRRVSEVRTYPTMTRSLAAMRDWLVGNGVTIVAMGSTSTYWKGAFYCLEEVMTAWLLNAAQIKAVPGRKTDVKDAEWIA